MKPFLFLFVCAIAPAQILRPSVGWMIDGNAQLREVTGIAASAIAGDAILSNVRGLACGALLCIAKTDDAVLASSGHITPAPSGAARFAVDGTSALVYFIETREFRRWINSELTAIDFFPEGEVLSLRVHGNGFDYAIRRGEETSIERYSFDDTGISLIAALGKTGAVMLHDTGILLGTGDGLRLIRPDGSQKDFPLANVISFWQMSSNAIGIATTNERWVMEITPFAETANLLPGAMPE